MNKYNPLSDKQALRDLAPEGYVYIGYDDGFYMYQKEIKGIGQLPNGDCVATLELANQ